MGTYTGPIIDCHHHFWEPELGRNPWLLPDSHIAFRYADYEPIKHSYLPPDLLADAKGFNLVGTVTMETEWDQEDSIGEMLHTQGIAEEYGLPNAAVAHAVLRDPDVEEVLARLAAMPLVRGVRNKPGQAASRNDATAASTLLTDPQWRHGYALLSRYGLSFDLQVAWWHANEAAELARTHPDTLMIIDHALLPSDRSEDGIAGWAEALKVIAAEPNVVIKVSGIGQRGRAWTVADNCEIVDIVAGTFGVDRIMFASNFPVDSLTGSYADVMGGFIEITEQWSPDEQAAAFAGNAARYYRLDGIGA